VQQEEAAVVTIEEALPSGDQAAPKPELENIILDSTKDAETVKLFANLLLKVKSSNYCIYDFRKNYKRTYLYKQFLEKELEHMINEM